MNDLEIWVDRLRWWLNIVPLLNLMWLGDLLEFVGLVMLVVDGYIHVG